MDGEKKMIKYTKHKIEVEESVPTHIVCDICEKEYSYDKDDMEIQEFHHIHFTGGYSSIFGDMVTVKSDICQHCLNAKLGQYLVIGEEDE